MKAQSLLNATPLKTILAVSGAKPKTMEDYRREYHEATANVAAIRQAHISATEAMKRERRDAERRLDQAYRAYTNAVNSGTN